tara:strand:- start:324 stop:1775 length:1452 start_codon:yes stop_codon:yes gene_type:complete
MNNTKKMARGSSSPLAKFVTFLTWLALCSAIESTGTETVIVSGPVTNGTKGGPFSAPRIDLASRGYVMEEFFLDGDASAYNFADGASSTPDGRWNTEREIQSTAYRTRILVVRPHKGSDFNGTVIVHWQNVTAGYELGSVGDDEYLRGYAWVGVSAQAVGVNGFPGPEAAGLRQWDLERYGSLNHPGDAYSYDIFTQAGRAVGPSRTKTGIDPMGGLDVIHLIAAGASQSAGRLRTYINGVHLLENVFDGFIPYIDFSSTIPFEADKGGSRRGMGQRTPIRTDINVPVFVVNSETEAEAYLPARQPDSKTFRLWEVAGTSHVSVPRSMAASGGEEGPNWMSYQPAYQAAIRHSRNWIVSDVEPPRMPRIAMTNAQTGRKTIERDTNGNAVGGIRLPDLAVPTARHRGTGRFGGGGNNRFAFLYGLSQDFDAEKLAKLYPNRRVFLDKYEREVDRCVKEAVLLADDVPAMLSRVTQWAQTLPAG